MYSKKIYGVSPYADTTEKQEENKEAIKSYFKTPKHFDLNAEAFYLKRQGVLFFVSVNKVKHILFLNQYILPFLYTNQQSATMYNKS